MTAKPRHELRGRGWILSLQRWRASGEPGLSSNLGAAPLVPLGRRGSGLRVAARLSEGERLWVSVTAPPFVAVAAWLTDGRALADEASADRAGGATIHRLARIEGAAAEGIGEDEIPAPSFDDTGAPALIVGIGRRRLSIALLRAEAFDALFGALERVEGEPSVYGGWRLP